MLAYTEVKVLNSALPVSTSLGRLSNKQTHQPVSYSSLTHCSNSVYPCVLECEEEGQVNVYSSERFFSDKQPQFIGGRL
jgi:hypothetical protein